MSMRRAPKIADEVILLKLTIATRANTTMLKANGNAKKKSKYTEIYMQGSSHNA